MIAIETVRAAVLDAAPWDRLDELVRAEMAAGRKVKEIADDLIPMADEVWDTPGLSEDGHDAFGDTLDALTGNCRSACWYKDPPHTLHPTARESRTAVEGIEAGPGLARGFQRAGDDVIG